MGLLDLAHGEGSEAMNSGSAVGRTIELFHRGRSIDQALAEIQPEVEAKWPKADMLRVATVARRYADDPRNQGDAVIVESLEVEVELLLPPHELDPTHEEIRIVGHLDQIRQMGGALELWDLKLSGRAAGYNLNAYALQQAAYLAATRFSFPDWNVRPGGLVMLNGYVSPKRNAALAPQECDVFARYQFSEKAWRTLLDMIRLSVAMVRRGEITTVPGDHCDFCDAGGLVGCLQLLDSVTQA